jgi:hypothetical protein
MNDALDTAAVRHAAVRYRTIALGQEQSARQRLARLRREVSRERVAHARWSVDEKKQTVAEQLRVDKDRMFNRDLRYHLADEPRATKAEVVRLAEHLNATLCAEPGPPVDRRSSPRGSWAHSLETPTWYRLFKQIADGVGRLTFAAWEHWLRRGLGISHDEIDDEALQRVWLSLDADCSGVISSGEFGAFMRLGQSCEEALRRRVHQTTISPARSDSRKTLALRKEAAQQVRREIELAKTRHAQAQLLSPDHAIMQAARYCDAGAATLERELAMLRELRTGAARGPGGGKADTGKRNTGLGSEVSPVSVMQSVGGWHVHAAEAESAPRASGRTTPPSPPPTGPLPPRGREALRAPCVWEAPPARSVALPERKVLPGPETPRRTFLQGARIGNSYY